GTIVVATEQTSGKGLDKNSWESESRKNLTFSILLKPEFLKPERQFMLNKAIALGLFDYIQSVIKNNKVTIKWPNDIYIDNGKVAGTLINNTISGSNILYSIIGIGININQSLFKSNAPNPVSLKYYLKYNQDLNECLKSFCTFSNIRYGQLKKHEHSRLNSDYLDALYRYKEVFPYRFKGEIVNAKITGVSEYGKLQLVTSDNKKLECDMKEIEYLVEFCLLR
ncbi:MAG: biotin--[acetyl-CoA-carboxylase] ligase, partial [Bacteroidales bacterium]|nr:biotin--[acetyl-CoA-carboxylase] ligase [Bacteroidales bacterium]